jgi:hypothetical protein
VVICSVLFFIPLWSSFTLFWKDIADAVCRLGYVLMQPVTQFKRKSNGYESGAKCSECFPVVQVLVKSEGHTLSFWDKRPLF